MQFFTADIAISWNVWYYNEKHSSDIISNSESESIMEDETDLINPEYEEFNDEE